MAGKEGTHADSQTGQTYAEGVQDQNLRAQNNPQLANIMAQYGQGKLSLADAMSQGQGVAASMGANNPQMDSWNQGQQSAVQNALNAHDNGKFANDQDKQDLIRTTQQAYEKDHAKPQNMGGTDMSAAFQNMIATNPMAAQRFASDQVQNDGILGKYFGQGGMQDQVLGQQAGLNANMDQDRQSLMGKDESYGLNQNDLKAYGQASGNISRMFGHAQQGLSQNLADRGLGAAPSGVAAQQFSGLQGNQNEQLGQLQTQIAQNRINTAKGLAEFRTQADAQRAAQNQSVAMQLEGQGQSAIANMRNQNLGAKAQDNSQVNAAAAQQRSLNDAMQNTQNNQFAQQQATRQKSFGEKLGDAFSNGIAGGIQSGTSDMIGSSIGDMNPTTGIGKIGGAVGGGKGAASLAAL